MSRKKQTLNKPNRKPLPMLQGTKVHKSCWDCANIRVGHQFYRTCLKRKVHIWSGGAEYEMNENGKTVADSCRYYELDKELQDAPFIADIEEEDGAI